MTKFLQKFNDLQVQTYTHINTLPGPGRANEFKVVIINLNRYLEEADQDRILLSDSITDISTVISDGKYMSWYCYTLLEEIISKYGDPYLKREMIDYTKLLHHFEANSRMSQIKGLILSQMRSNCLLLKVPCYHEHQMMADIRRYRNNYAHRIGVPESSIHPYSVLGTSPPAIYFIVPVVLLPRVFLPQSSFDRLNALLSQQLEDRVIHNLSIEEADQLINVIDVLLLHTQCFTHVLLCYSRVMGVNTHHLLIITTTNQLKNLLPVHMNKKVPMTAVNVVISYLVTFHCGPPIFAIVIIQNLRTPTEGVIISL